MSPAPINYEKPAARRSRNPLRGWALVSLALAMMGLIVMPSNTEPGWGPSLVMWGGAAAALVVHLVLPWRA
jgi:hypothetical protein